MLPLERYMIDEIAIIRFDNYDNIDGRIAFTAPEIVLARVEAIETSIRNADGQQIDLSHTVATRAIVNNKDKIILGEFVPGQQGRKIILPLDDSDNKSRSPLRIKYCKDRLGTSGHTEFNL